MPWGVFRNREIRRSTCLRGFTGRDYVRSGWFAAETLKEKSLSYEAGRWTIPIGSLLTNFVAKYESIEPDPTKVKIFEKLGTNANAVQSLNETGTPTGGSFTVAFGGQTTSGIKYNASIAEIATALIGLTTIASSENVEVTSEESKPINEKAAKITFKGELGNEAQPLVVVNSAGLTGGTTPKVTATTTTPGTTAESIIGVYDGPEWDGWGNTAEEQNLNWQIPIYFQNCAFDINKIPEYKKYGLLAKAALTTCTFT